MSRLPLKDNLVSCGETIREPGELPDLFQELKTDCGNCRGLCCTALYFSRSEGFPFDKEAGTPCTFLASDYRCTIHGELAQRKLKGCMAYDCMGAGRKVTKAVGGGARREVEAFPVVYELHQMLWYLAEASVLIFARQLRDEILDLILENETMTRLDPDGVPAPDIEAYRHRVGGVLRKTGELLQQAVLGRTERNRKRDYIGRDFQRGDLSGKDFSLSLLIASDLRGCRLYGTNFLGADLRDADIRDTDLSQSVFLTQRQINSARGNRGTVLPPMLSPPASWLKDE